MLNFLKQYCSSNLRETINFSRKVTMSTNTRGQILSGTDIAREIRDNLKVDVEKLKTQLPDFEPGLAIVQVGGREDSNVYIRMKIKAANEIGIKSEHVKLPRNTTEVQLLSKLNQLNNDPNIHGIIVQMPLDSDTEINSHLITDSVSQLFDFY